jgi:hypothetical protein
MTFGFNLPNSTPIKQSSNYTQDPQGSLHQAVENYGTNTLTLFGHWNWFSLSILVQSRQSCLDCVGFSAPCTIWLANIFYEFPWGMQFSLLHHQFSLFYICVHEESETEEEQYKARGGQCWFEDPVFCLNVLWFEINRCTLKQTALSLCSQQDAHW